MYCKGNKTKNDQTKTKKFYYLKKNIKSFNTLHINALVIPFASLIQLLTSITSRLRYIESGMSEPLFLQYALTHYGFYISGIF